MKTEHSKEMYQLVNHLASNLIDDKKSGMPRSLTHSFAERREKGYNIKPPPRTKKLFGRPAL